MEDKIVQILPAENFEIIEKIPRTSWDIGRENRYKVVCWGLTENGMIIPIIATRYGLQRYKNDYGWELHKI